MGEQYIRSHRHSWWPSRPPWITLMSVSLLVNWADTSISCGPGLKTIGVTVPRGDIFIEYGSGTPLEITCVLDPDHEIVKNLFRNDTTDGGEAKMPSQRILFYKNAERVSRQYMTLINATAAQLRISNPPASRNTYYCVLLLDDQLGINHSYNNMSTAQLLCTPSSDLSTFSTPPPTSLETRGPPSLVSQTFEVVVCLNSVAVGYKPGPITNYSCKFGNRARVICKWTKPEKNPINTSYKLFVTFLDLAVGRTLINCNEDSDSRENTCYWDFTTSPVYMQPYEYYYFTVHGDNVLGNLITPISFLRYYNIDENLEKLTDITVVDKTESSVMLSWSIGTKTAFPQKLISKIEYWHKDKRDSNPKHRHSVNMSDVCNLSSTSNQTNSYSNCRKRDTECYNCNITDLKYPSAYYEFCIFVRYSVAPGEFTIWSSPDCITLKTKPSIPRRPPRTDVGSFECVTSPDDKSKRDVFIYWQDIEDNEKCGDSFQYLAYYSSTTDNKTIIHHRNKTYKNHAKFEALSTDIGYNFTVYSSNEEGLSTEYSTIFVPNESDKLDEPQSFTKLGFDEEGVFELSWENSNSRKLKVSDYTLFWCENDKDRPYQCNGYMNWMHIPSSESCYNITVTDHMKIYQFAISANSQISLKTGIISLYQPTYISSGMVWATCTVIHNKMVGKIKNIWVNLISSTSMELRWKLDCSDRIGSILGCRIFYCPVVSINNSTCKEPMLNKTVSDEMVQDSRGIASITDLKSNTTYVITIALITKRGEGLHSDPLLNTTLEEGSRVLPGLTLVHHLTIWLLIVLFTYSMYWGKRLWRKYLMMNNIEVVLPPSLSVHFRSDHHNNIVENVLESPPSPTPPPPPRWPTTSRR